MSADFSFDATKVKTFEPLEPGKYLVQLISGEIRPLKSGNGNGLSLTFEVLDGKHKKRRLFSHMNIEHTTPRVKEIAEQQLAQLCFAVDVEQLDDLSQLYGVPLHVKVKIKPAANGYPEGNEIVGYE